MRSSTLQSRELLEQLKDGKALSTRQQLKLITALSLPAVMAQMSTVIMEYMDQAMVGRLGAASSASIGLISSTTWLLGGICSAASTGFTVQIAHRIGAREEAHARALMKHGLVIVAAFCTAVALLCLSISGFLPVWLGGGEDIIRDSTVYFRIFSIALPVIHLSGAAAGMLQCSGDVRTPSILNVFGCCLNVLFNFLLIFPSRTVMFMGQTVAVPGAGLSVAGAALGTALSQAAVAAFMLWCLLFRSHSLHLRKEPVIPFSARELRRAVAIAVPVGIEQSIMGFGYVMATRIVSPLGSVPLAANSFAITAESLCYMPGHGIAVAATALVGQSLGAGRRDLAKRLGWLSTGFGMIVMTCTGMLLYIFAPKLMGIMTPDMAIISLGTRVLRIEAFAEPLFAASMVASGAFRGAGDTLGPSVINFVSMWAVRLTLGSYLTPRIGLTGMWIAMCIDICTRGTLFLIRLYRKPPGHKKSA